MSRARISDIITLAARMADVSEAAIKGHSRKRPIVHVRHAIIVVARANGHSFPEIARVMNRDHSSIVHSFHRVDKASLKEFTDKLADEAKTVTPFLDGMKIDLVLPPRAPRPSPRSTKPKNDFGPGKFIGDGSHAFHTAIAIGSAKLAAAIAQARAA